MTSAVQPLSTPVPSIALHSAARSAPPCAPSVIVSVISIFQPQLQPSPLTCTTLTQQCIQLPLCVPSVFRSVTSTIQPLSTPVYPFAPDSVAHSVPPCVPSLFLSVISTSDLRPQTSATTLFPHLHHTHSAVHSAPSLCALYCCSVTSTIQPLSTPVSSLVPTRSSAFSSLFVRPQCFALLPQPFNLSAPQSPQLHYTQQRVQLPHVRPQ